MRFGTGSLVFAIGAGCTPAAERNEAPPTTALPVHLTATEEYLPGVAADIYLPTRLGSVPLVVMVPGGAWVEADRAGLGPLADQLAADGIAVVNATYRPASSGVRFPVPVQDVLCAVSFAVARVRTAGADPRPVIVLGHSSGAHLAALAALAPERFRADCAYPPATADALVGLAGTYEVTDLVEVAMPLFDVSPEEDPVIWREGNPMTWVAERPSLPVFIGHGDADELVPLSFSTTFADALKGAGHPVHVEIVPGADHHDIYAPEVIEDQLSAWIRSLS